jgi:hypothetical protein
MNTAHRPLLFFVFILFAACGGSGGTTPVGNSSGLPRSSTLASLTSGQGGTLCDWVNAKEGGYGRTFNCPDGSQAMSDPDRASCVDVIGYLGTNCPTLTVANLEDCANASGTDVCSIPTQTACAAFDACVGP